MDVPPELRNSALSRPSAYPQRIRACGILASGEADDHFPAYYWKGCASASGVNTVSSSSRASSKQYRHAVVTTQSRSRSHTLRDDQRIPVCVTNIFNEFHRLWTVFECRKTGTASMSSAIRLTTANDLCMFLTGSKNQPCALISETKAATNRQASFVILRDTG